MRVNIVKSRHSIQLDNLMYEIKLTSKLYMKNRPKPEITFGLYSDVTKSVTDIDVTVNEFKLNKTSYPTYTKGDYKKINEEYILNSRKQTKNNTLLVTVDKTGLVTETRNMIKTSEWTTMPFSMFNKATFPSDVKGLGVTNAIPLDGTGNTKVGFKYSNRNDRRDNAPVTAEILRKVIREDTYFEVGDVILVDNKGANNSLAMYPIKNTLIDKKENPILYSIVGDDYSKKMGGNLKPFGKPWTTTIGRQLKTDYTSKEPNFKEVRLDNIKGLGGCSSAATVNKAFLIGGFRGSASSISNEILMSEIKNGLLTGFTKISNFPVKICFASSLISYEHLYVIGGVTDLTNMTPNTNIYRAEINADGSLKPFEIFGPKLNKLFINPNCFFVNNRLIIMGSLTYQKGKIVYGRDNAYMDIRSNGMKWTYGINQESFFEHNGTSFLYNLYSLFFHRDDKLYYAGYNTKNSNKLVLTTYSIYDYVPLDFDLAGTSPNGTNSVMLSNQLSDTNIIGQYDGGSDVSWNFSNLYNKFSYMLTYRTIGFTSRGKLITMPVDPTPRYHYTTLVTGNGIYILGGVTSPDITPTNNSGHLTNIVLEFVNTSPLKDNYREMVKDDIENSPTFKLPIFEPLLIDSKFYDWYIVADPK